MVDVIIKIVHVAVVVLVVAGQAAVSFGVPAFLLAVILIVQVVGLQVVAQPVHQVVVPGAVVPHVELSAALPALGHAVLHKVLDGHVVVALHPVPNVLAMVDVIIKIVHVAVVVLVVAGQAAVSFGVPAFLLAVILIVQVVGLQVVAQPVHQVVVPGAVTAHIKLLAGLPALGHAMVEEVLHGLLAAVTGQIRVVADVVFVVVHRGVLSLKLFQTGGGGLIVLAAQAAVPIVHVHVAAHAAHRAIAGVLPHLIAAAVAAAGAPLCHPAVPVFKH